MVIKMEEKGSLAFYAEGLQLGQQYRKLKEKPHRKLKNTFRNTGYYCVGCVAMSVAVLALGLVLGYDFAILACFTLLLVAGILSGRRYLEIKRHLQKFQDSFVPSALTVDEDGIVLSNSQTKALRMPWSEVQFVRVFQECICFMSKEENGFIISVNALYKDEIIPYVKENHPEVMLIQ